VLVQAELTVEPFVPGWRGPHVEAASAAASDLGATVEVGPFGDRLVGEADVVLSAVAAAVLGALTSGATRVSIQVAPAVEGAASP
jgi:uncharacterized protein YqgV (UPF0045/DUF77 family)